MTINIPIFENFRIRSDSQQIMLVEEIAGREKIHGYFSTIENSIQYFITLKIRRFDSTSILGLINSINSLRTALNTALHPLNLMVVAKKQEKEE